MKGMGYTPSKKPVPQFVTVGCGAVAVWFAWRFAREGMMFGWLSQKLRTSAIKLDTKKTIRAVLEMPENTQREIALEVAGEIFRAIKEIEQTPATSADRDEVMKKQVGHATARRHQALMEGANDRSDPNWATAALIEGWLMANTGTMGRDAFDQIDGLTLGWASSVLSDADLEKLKELAREDQS